MKGADGIKNALGRLCARMKQDKRLEIAVYGVLILIGVLLFLISPNDKAGNAAQSGTEAAADESGVEELENRLEGILGTIRGAGKVRVMITYDTSSRLVPAMSTDVQSGTTENTSTGGQSVSETRTESSRPATISGSGGTETIVLTEIEPTVRGVIVIAEGAADVSVRVKLSNAVMTVLGISADRIEVFEMKRGEGEQ